MTDANENHEDAEVHVGWALETVLSQPYQVYCSICGRVGRSQENEVDAEAIADRHRADASVTDLRPEEEGKGLEGLDVIARHTTGWPYNVPEPKE